MNRQVCEPPKASSKQTADRYIKVEKCDISWARSTIVLNVNAV